MMLRWIRNLSDLISRLWEALRGTEDLTRAYVEDLQTREKERKPCWLMLAEEEMGVQEVRGSKHNPRILDYHAATKLGASDDETPWCASFVNFCLDQCGCEGTGSAAARSFLSLSTELGEPKLGCIVVFWRKSPSSWSGHVGFYVGEDSTHIHVLGGNQGDRVSVARYPKKRLLGFRWPAEKSATA